MAILISNNLVVKNEGYGRTINQIFELYLNSHEGFKMSVFKVAIIELFEGGTRKIHLNDNARVQIEFYKPFLTKEDEGKEKVISLHDIKNVSWPDDGLDENSAKILVLKWDSNNWILSFNFRYNQAEVIKIKKRAREFYSAVQTLLRKKTIEPHVLTYLMWSIAELIIDTELRLLAIQLNDDHKERNKRIKQPIGKTLFSQDFAKLFKKLSEIKNNARYARKKSFDPNIYNKTKFRDWMKVLKSQLK